MKTILLDNGHGGIINGFYQTSGKRSPVWSDGTILYEGEFNRAIVNGIIQELTKLKIPYVNIAPEYEDISLEERVKRANMYNAKNSVYVSIHSNAGDPSAYGWEIYTGIGQTESDKIADVFIDKLKIVFPEAKVRSDLTDKDLDKEEDFYVLKYTKMPAVLTENFFMTNEKECKEYLLNSNGRSRIIKYHVDAIKEIASR